MATIAHDGSSGWSFWQKMALGMALFVVAGFAQFAARGFVNFGAVPPWVHIHGIVMLVWLTLGFVQPTLAQANNLALHRTLGWLGVGAALTVTVLGSYSGIMAIVLARVPPFFTPPYFLALTQIGIAVFAAMVLAALIKRRDTLWHQRLMLGSTILILEPGAGPVAADAAADAVGRGYGDGDPARRAVAGGAARPGHAGRGASCNQDSRGGDRGAARHGRDDGAHRPVCRMGSLARGDLKRR